MAERTSKIVRAFMLEPVLMNLLKQLVCLMCILVLYRMCIFRQRAQRLIDLVECLIVGACAKLGARLDTNERLTDLCISVSVYMCVCVFKCM